MRKVDQFLATQNSRQQTGGPPTALYTTQLDTGTGWRIIIYTPDIPSNFHGGNKAGNGSITNEITQWITGAPLKKPTRSW